MKLIINASGVRATGATQVSVSFIKECVKHPVNQYYVFVSLTVASQLDQLKFSDNFIFYVFEHKPFFNLKGIKTWRQLIKLEKEIKPDCVFSVFGPSVWKPNAPHLMGYAYPYYVYPESPYFKILSFKRRLIIKLQKMFHKHYLQQNGKHYVCETEDVSSRLPAYINCKSENVYTVTNSYSEIFNEFKPNNNTILPIKKKNEFRFVTLSSFALHKNLTILNEIIPVLQRRLPKLDIKFILTVNEELFKTRIKKKVKSQIYNLGRIDVADCPQVYHESDAMFLPTLMECFSASYAESMKMGKPIITSDLPFATTVCGDAALYFDPLNPEDIVNKMISLIESDKFKSDLIAEGYEQLKRFDTPKTKADKYLDLCKRIVKN